MEGNIFNISKSSFFLSQHDRMPKLQIYAPYFHTGDIHFMRIAYIIIMSVSTVF